VAISYVGEVCKGTGSTASFSTTVATAPGAGNLIVGRIGFRAASTASMTSVTDSKGNTWTLDAKINNSSGHAYVVSTIQNAGTLTTSDTITVHFSTAPSNGAAVIFDQFSGMTNTVDQTASASATTTTRSAGTTSATTNANDLQVAAYAGNGSESAWAKGATFSNFTTASLNFSTTAMVEGQYKILSSTGTQAAAATGVSLTTEGAQAIYEGSSSSTTYNDSGSGTITLSGPSTESLVATESRSGTITLSGTSTQSFSATDARSGTITLSGTSTQSLSATDAGSGTIVLSGTGVDQYGVIYSDSGTGTITLSGSIVQAISFVDALTGSISLTGTATESFSGGSSLNPFLLYRHTGLARLNNIEQWLSDNTSFERAEDGGYTGLSRVLNVYAYLEANPLSGVTFVPYNHAGTDEFWAVEEYLLQVTDSNG
jgi:hypothetical protein